MEMQRKHNFLMKRKREWLCHFSRRKMSLRKFDPAKSGECNLDISRVTKFVFLGFLRLKPTPQLLNSDSPLLLEELVLKSGEMRSSPLPSSQIVEKASSENDLCKNDSRSEPPAAICVPNKDEEQKKELPKPVVPSIKPCDKKDLNQVKVEAEKTTQEIEALNNNNDEEPVYAELKTVEEPFDKNISTDSLFTSECDFLESTDIKLTRHIEKVINLKEINTIEKMLQENEAEIENMSPSVDDPTKHSSMPAKHKFVREPTPEIVLLDSDEDAIDQLMYNIVDIKLASQNDDEDFFLAPEINIYPNRNKNVYQEVSKDDSTLSNLPKESKMLPKRKKPQCKICSQIFKNYLQLKKHKSLHDGERPYTCPKCNGSHSSLDLLIAHLRIHEGKRPYNCKKCNKDFKTAKALEKHQPVHVLKKIAAPKKIFKCELCGKEFRKLCDLDRHTRVHTGEKPSICNICNRRFQQAHNLNKHLLIHTKEKPFQCDICHKKFGRNDVLNRHLLTHSIEKPNRCEVCMKTFIRPSQLIAHREKVHSPTGTPHGLNSFN